MGIEDLVAYLGDRHVARPELPPALAAYVQQALNHGLVIEDCRDRLAVV